MSAADVLDGILSEAGQPTDSVVTITGSDPVLPTRFPIGEFGAAAIGAAASQVARLHELRSGVRQRVDLDVGGAALAMRSSRHLVVDPPVPAPALAPVGSYRTADGRWLFTQRLFPHHFARQLEVLGCGADESEIAAAVATRDGFELEEAMVANGASAALVRTAAEWAAHPQSAAVESLPLVELTRIGDAEPIPLPGGDRPLSGLRVLDVTRVLAGPTCARTLAEQGADVLRISSPLAPDDPRMLIDTGHGKRSTVLDLRDQDGLGAFRALLADADVVSEGYRPGALARFGLDAESLAAMRPGIVAVRLSAFGRRGPWSDRRGFDSIVQAVSGIGLENGDGDAPRFLPANPLDYITGYLAAFGVLVALERRAREGGSWRVEVSLAATGHRLRSMPLTDADAAAARPAEPSAEEVERLSLRRDTAFGALRYLAPAARFSATPAGWELPSAPADANDAVWQP